jgi:hypothetical protein
MSAKAGHPKPICAAVVAKAGLKSALDPDNREMTTPIQVTVPNTCIATDRHCEGRMLG